MIIRNIISVGQSALNEKHFNLKKRWYSLKTSNISEVEYRKKERDLKKAEQDEMQEIKEDIFNKLCSSRIKGFESKEVIIDNLKRKYRAANPAKSGEAVTEDFEINEQELVQMKEDQMHLIDKLLGEKMFSHPDSPTKENNLIRIREANRTFNKNFGLAGSGGLEPKTMEKQFPGTLISETISAGGAVKHTMTLTKYFGFANQKEGEELMLDRESTDLEKNFLSNIEKGFGVADMDKYKLNNKELEIILDQRQGKALIDEKFHKNMFDKYKNILRNLERNSSFDLSTLDDLTLNELIKITSYLINCSHYSQKSKENFPFIHPYDLLFILEKFK
eukprot:TRINITY_DN4018_c0_g1_i3.p2 TRINITY_DN4018_c0_g1~~TRINITY_DN4018_c0_g1_i3.p2  ORF type:complete len:333 (-),score=94.71 TRINITY_DN4018_c0_g1_i3:214-1212(-)